MHDGDRMAGEVLLPQNIVNAAAVRQTVVVSFSGRKGRRSHSARTLHLEHDNNRMARGEPCTHIYNASDARPAGVAFIARQLTRPRTART